MLEPITRQAAFDAALFGVRRQNYKPSIAPNKSAICAYRGKDDMKCGIGHSLPDELYRAEFDAHPGNTFDDLVLYEDIGAYYRECSETIALDGRVRTFGALLQLVHDQLSYRSGCAENFEKGMTELANAAGLRYTPPEETTP